MTHDTSTRISRFVRLSVAIIAVAVATGLAIGMPACGDDDDPAAPDGGGTFSGTIQVRDNSFSPRTATITVGDSVTWQWVGSSSHTVTHGTPGNTGTLFNDGPKSSGTFGFRFNTTGSIPYYCIIHGSMMTGTITVRNP